LSAGSGVPAAELDALARQIRAHPQLLSTEHVAAEYRSLGLAVFPDAFSRETGERAKGCLASRRPFSAIRIGDGEASLLAAGVYPDTPALDRHAVRETLALQEDRFEADELWTGRLRELMLAAVAQADVVGVLGLWRAAQKDAALRVEALASKLPADPRGVSGHWRGIDVMLRLARDGALNGKTVASAHLYFGILEDLPAIIAQAERTILVSRSAEVHRALQRRHPGMRIEHVPVGVRGIEGPVRARPDFLLDTLLALPKDLRGCLCLVGAGIWAEPYCAWIRQRGGVAIDLGSGFDLMEGRVTRTIHDAIAREKLEAYVLGRG